jgi:hypothetical protein
MPTKTGETSSMQQAWSDVTDLVSTYVPDLLFALVILVVGWLAALTASWLVRSALRRTSLDNRLATWVVGAERARTLDIERATGRTVFFLLMLFVLVAFFQALGLTLVTEPLNSALNEISAFAPRLLGAASLLLLGWLVASAMRLIVSGVLGATRLDARLGDQAGLTEGQRPPLSKTLGDTVYWLVLLLFLPAVLGALSLEGLLAPVQGMLAEILAYLPNLFAAGLILLVGWFLARILQRIVSSLLVSAGADRLSESVGLARALGRQQLSGMLGVVVYVLVLIPVVIAALNALELEAISQPASDMLNRILAALPALFGALVVLLVAWVLGRLVSGLVVTLLAGVGFDLVLARLGLGREPEEAPEAQAGGRTPSQIAGFVVLLAIMLLAAMEAFRLLGFQAMADLTQQFYVFGGKVLLGVVMFALGLLVANLVHQKIRDSGAQHAALLAGAARIAILVVIVAMALQQTGLGSDVINIVLGVVLGALAVAVAIAFGLGGREAAGRLVDRWTRSLGGDS